MASYASRAKTAYRAFWESRPKTVRTLKFFAWVPVALFVTEHVYCIATVTGRSMQPTFNPDASILRRDIVLLNRWVVATRSYSIGDVVTLWSPTEPDVLMTKRILALEGDTVKTLPPYPDRFVVVPRGHCWVEGDESFHSRDSNTFGPVPLGLINARIDHIIWPHWRFGAVPTYTGKESRVFHRKEQGRRHPPRMDASSM